MLELSSSNDKYKRIFNKAIDKLMEVIGYGSQIEIDEQIEETLEVATMVWLGITRSDYNKLARTVDKASNSSIETRYSISGSSYTNYINELRETLYGLSERIKELIAKALDENELADEKMRKTTKAVIAGVLIANLYQKTRIVETETENIRQLVDLDLLMTFTLDSGIRATKTWRTRGDDKVCPICKAMDGVTVYIDEPFIVNGAAIDTDTGAFVFDYKDRLVASAHPNDRCVIEINFE